MDTNVDKELAQKLYDEWDQGRGTSKSELERRTWNDGSSHGKRFDKYIKKNLGLPTTNPSKQTVRIQELERQVRSLGQHPINTDPSEETIQLLQSREACLSALQIWNDPAKSFRTGAFSLLFITAWNSLLIAISIRDGIEWRQIDEQENPVFMEGMEKSLNTSELTDRALSGNDWLGTRENIKFWIDLRNKVAHRYLPILDIHVIPYAQSGLLNFERVLTSKFGEEYGLSDQLSVPLQLAGFRDPDFITKLRNTHTQLPIEVQSLLSRAGSVSPDLLEDPTYMLRITFVPFVPTSGRNPDAVAHFVKPGEISQELADTLTNVVVMDKLVRIKRPEYGAKRVVAEVSKRIPFRFNPIIEMLMPPLLEAEVSKRIPFRFNKNDHARVGRYFKVRPKKGHPDRSLNETYCDYIPASGIYVYNDLWIDKVVEQISTPNGYRQATGRDAIQK